MADYEIENSEDLLKDVFSKLQDRIIEKINDLISQADSALPIILTAHASIEGAKFGGERLVMLGNDLVLSGSLVKNPKFSYVAMGHIHKPQDVNQGAQPPVIYPGSIERVDFGEAADDRFFVIADVQKGNTNVQWRKLTGARPFIDRRAVLESAENVMQTLKSALPRDMDGTILRLTVEYPREMDSLIDEPELRRHAAKAFEFHLVKRPQTEARIRLPADQTVSSLSPLDLLDQYWRASHTEPADAEALQKLAREILAQDNESDGNSL